MDLLNIVMIGSVPVVAVLVWLIYDQLFLSRNVVKILLFEKVGNAKHFKGVYKATEKYTDNLGYYLRNRKIGLKIPSPNVESFFPSKPKAIAICQYGTADFRVMRVMNDAQFFAREEQVVMEEVSVSDPNDPAKKIVVEQPKKMKDGSFITEEVEVVYEDPIGITQTAREVGRFNRAFHREMDLFQKKKEGLLDKYGGLIINGAVIAIFFVIVMILYTKNLELEEKIIMEFSDASDKYISEIQSPSFMRTLVDQMQREENIAEAPIS